MHSVLCVLCVLCVCVGGGGGGATLHRVNIVEMAVFPNELSEILFEVAASLSHEVTTAFEITAALSS